MFIANFDGLLHPVADGSGLLTQLFCNPAIVRLTTYGLGCSVVAMFNRVAGGNYTKAADISADIVAKNRHDLPEDDSRMPNTVADFIGDNVNDIAGNGSDLLESFVATLVSSVLIATMLYNSEGMSDGTLRSMVLYPIALAAGGLLACIVGLGYALLHRAGNNPSHELDLATYIAAAGSTLFGAITAFMLFGKVEMIAEFRWGWISPWIASVLGVVSGNAIGKFTEYYTDTKYSPVKSLVKFATEGEAFLVSKGDALGFRSGMLPVLMIALSLILSYNACGVYGIAIAAVGMLSFVGVTVSIDAFGPIADNAGGFAESCHLGEEVRAITDQLDAVGNTTAAIGKGMAIGSAAFATLSLLFSYVGSYMTTGELTLNIIDIYSITGAMIGGALVSFFCAILTDNTIDSAYKMADEGDRQLSIPGVLEGTVLPDYSRVIAMAANEALKKMLTPSLIALVVPVVGGFMFGPEFVGGILIGATITAIPTAIFMGNSGGAFDNTKKSIESSLLAGHGKGSAAHKAAVTGDTIGDTRKDVVGVALDIFIKTMSTVANTLAPLFFAFHLL